MKYVDEFRGAPEAPALVRAIRRAARRRWTLMEVCGGQTHTLIQWGIDRLIEDAVEMVHGPGCPVCVTPVETIDRAIALAARPDVVLASFGDMLRVPGSQGDLASARARGADVRAVYSPLDALRLAESMPKNHVVFLAVGFETTAPTTAMAAFRARERGLRNFSLLCAHVRVPPAVEAILSAPDNAVEGLLAAGHVCTVMGYREYEPIAARYRVPITVTGFEPVDLLQGVHGTVVALEKGRFGVENQYRRAVVRDGNVPARHLLGDVFRICDRAWRGLGVIPGSGLALSEAFSAWDAERRFDLSGVRAVESPRCRAGDVLRGRLKPPECPAFGAPCTPASPLGAPMVSSEGACAAYFRYRRGA